MPGRKPTRPRYLTRDIAPNHTDTPGSVERAMQIQTDAINALAGEPRLPQRGAEGDVYYRAQNGDVVKRPIGAEGHILTVVDNEQGNGLVPDWRPAGAATLADGDYGDITVSGGGTSMTIDADAVTNAKLADMPAATLKGNDDGGAANPQDLTAAEVLALLGLTGVAPVAAGTFTLDFGAAPTDTATVAVTDAGVAAGSKVVVSVAALATADHTADDILVMGVQALPGTITAGVGFDVRGFCPSLTTGDVGGFWVRV